MPVQFPSFNVFDAGRAVTMAENYKGQQQRNALLGQQVEENQTVIANRDKVKKIRQMHDNAPEILAKLEADGLHQEADQFRTQMRGQFDATLELMKSMDGWVDKDNYKELRSQLLQQGIVEPDDMPVEYSKSFFARKKAEIKNKASVYSFRGPGPGGTVQTQDVVQDEYGNVLQRGKPFESSGDRAARLKGDKDAKGKGAGGFKSADANTLSSQAARLYGGFYNPVTGQFAGLDKTQAAQVQALVEEAERIFMTGGIGHGTAIAQAGRNLGIDIENVAGGDDPLGLRQ